jgi:hypothetical protein
MTFARSHPRLSLTGIRGSVDAGGVSTKWCVGVVRDIPEKGEISTSVPLFMEPIGRRQTRHAFRSLPARASGPNQASTPDVTRPWHQPGPHLFRAPFCPPSRLAKVDALHSRRRNFAMRWSFRLFNVAAPTCASTGPSSCRSPGLPLSTGTGAGQRRQSMELCSSFFCS